MIRFALTSLALAALSAGANAQTAELNTGFQPVTGPIQHYNLDYASGTLTKVGVFGDQQPGINSASVSTYANTCTSGFFTPTGPTDEFVDWGMKTAGASTVVDTFTFGYATGELDPSVGGPGATVEIAFYSGTTGFGTLGTEVARFTFSGLPGASMAGGISSAAVTVTLAGGGTSAEFCLPDGMIGYGYCSPDLGASTGPLIGDILTCPLGQADAFDIFTCPASTGVYAGTFFFGGSPTATWFMDITEDDGLTAATTTPNIGLGINPGSLSDAGTPPVLDSTWPLLHTTDFLHTMSGAVWFGGSFPPGTVTITNGFGMQEVIVDTGAAFGLVQFGSALGSGLWDQSTIVPKDTTLIGLPFTTQAVGYGGGVPYWLSNAIDTVVGF